MTTDAMLAANPRPADDAVIRIALRWDHLVLITLLLAALGLRLIRLDESLYDFSTMRQSQAALIARSIYFELDPTVPPWRVDVNTTVMNTTVSFEPPILETIAAALYRVAGGEQVWLARLVTVSWYLVAAVFVFLIAGKLSTPSGALFSTAVFLFFPYGIAASRALFVDVLMVMLMLITVYLMLRYDEQPTNRRWLFTVIAMAAAVFIKLQAFPVLAVVYAALALRREGWRALINLRHYGFALLAVAPAGTFYIATIAASPAVGRGATRYFQPSLWLQGSFYSSWAYLIERTLSGGAVLIALVCVPFARRGRPLLVIAALWVGYTLYGMIFNFHISSHDYYQLQLIPTLALSTAPIGVFLMDRVGSRWAWRAAVVVVAVVGLIVWGVNSGRILNTANSDRETVQAFQSIGEAIGHSQNAVFLTDHWAMPLMYYGEISGRYWWTRYEQEMYSGSGISQSEQILAADRLALWRADGVRPDYFVVTDFAEFDRQPDLQAYLGTFPLVAQADRYVIYDIRSAS